MTKIDQLTPMAMSMQMMEPNISATPEHQVSVQENSYSNPIQKSFRPEAQLIFACSRTVVDSNTASLIKELLQQDLDWSYIIQKSQLNGVTPLVCYTLITNYAALVPKEVFDKLKGFFNQHAQRNLLMAAELISIVRLLESNDVPVLPFKGPTLAVLAYNNLSLRQFCDLDILVHHRHIKRAIELLESRGYKLVTSPSWAQKMHIPASRKKDYSLVNEAREIRAELHWKFSGGHFDLPLNMQRLWNQCNTLSLAGQTIRGLPLTELLLYLTMHGSRHGWGRLAWICDIAELIRVHQEIDWETQIEQARLLGGERNLALGLLLANQLLDAPLPEKVLERIKTDTVVCSVAEDVHKLLFRDNDDSLDISYFHHYHPKMKERFRDRVRLHLHYYYRYARLAITPNAQDRAFLRLPKFLYSLHYIARPIRLIHDRGLTRLRQWMYKRT